MELNPFSYEFHEDPQPTYRWLREHLSAAMVEEYFRPLGVGRVIRYDVPNLEGLNFVLPHALGGGGSRSLRIDAQGKTLGMALLEMPIEPPEELCQSSDL